MHPDYLTDEELYALDTLLGRISIPDKIDAGAPIRAQEPISIYTSILVLEQQGRCRLSADTRAREIERLAKIERKRKGLRERKVYTRKRGTVHPKKKQATERRRRAKTWKENPLVCVLYADRYKCKAIDAAEFKWITNPLWVKFDPKDLSVKFPREAGTRANPWTCDNMKIYHKELGLVFDGEAHMLWKLSGGIMS